jgi:hypothetical protein
MAGQEDIVTNIVLAGDAQVIAGLTAVGAAGVLAFNAIEQAVRGNSLSALASSIGAVTGATAILVAGLFEWARASSELVAVQSRLASSQDTNLETMSSTIAALTATGASVDGLTVSMRRMATRFELEWPSIQKSVRGAADLIVKDQLHIAEALLGAQEADEKVTSAHIALQKAQIDKAFIGREVAQQQVNDNLKVAGSVLTLQEAQEALANVGQTLSKSEQEDIQRRRLAFQVQAAAAAVTDAEITRQKNLASARLRVAEAAEKVRQAQLAEQRAQIQVDAASLQIREARRKAEEDEAHSVANAAKFVRDTIAGVSTEGNKAELSVKNIIRGFIAEAKTAEGALTGSGKSLADFGSSSPKMFGALIKLADLFKNLKDETLKEALAVELMGRSFSQSLIEVLELGGDEVQRVAKRFKELGFEFTSIKERGEDSDEFLQKKFRRTLGTLAAEVSILGTQIGTRIFSPAFVPLLELVTGAIEKNRQHILDWAAGIRDSVMPAVVGLVQLISGEDLTKKFNLNPAAALKAQQWQATFQFIKDKANEAVEFIKSLFLDKLPGAFKIISNILKTLAGQFKAITGLDVDGVDAAIIILIGSFTGATQAVVLLAGAITGVLIVALRRLAAAALANPFTLIILAIAFLIAGFAALGFAIAGIENDFTRFVDKWTNKVKEWVSTKVSGAWDWITKDWDLVGNFIGSKLKQISADIGNWVSTKIGDGWAWLTADWGLVGNFIDSKLKEWSQLIGNWISTKVGNGWQWIVDSFTAIGQALVTKAGEIKQSVVTLISTAVDGVWDWLSTGFQTVTDKLKGIWTTFVDWLKSLIPDASIFTKGLQAAPGGQVGATFAGGGHVRGPGTSLSDSILAWLSDNEFVVRAAAVSKYGTGFLHAINNLSFPRGFAMGGLVSAMRSPAPIPAFALGGPVGLQRSQTQSMQDRALTLVLDGRSFDGLRGPAGVVNALERHASRQQLASTGPKPRWFK